MVGDSNAGNAQDKFAPNSLSLTRGLARNTVFNLVGWAWPIFLSLISVPYIVMGLGNDAYGIFGITSLVAGYLSVINSPFSTGNVRFLAEAYGRQAWGEFQQALVSGIAVVSLLSLFASAIMFLLADLFARRVFKIPSSLVVDATFAFRLASVSFLFNGIAASMRGVSIAVRRFDLVTIVNMALGTLSTAGVILAISLGTGLRGAMVVRFVSSGLGVIAYGFVAWLIARRMGIFSVRKFDPDLPLLKRMLSFSAFLFGSQMASTIGIQLDRTLIGVLIGTSAVTFYILPTKITDKISGLITQFTKILYPLSAESLAAENLDALRQLYTKAVRTLSWISWYIATGLIGLSKEFLSLWVGPEFVENSWLVLSLLAAAQAWRAGASVAYQVCNGLGNSDVTIRFSFLTLISFSVSIIVFTPIWGINGAALGVLVGVIIAGTSFDVFVQRKMLHQTDWSITISSYLKPMLVCLIAVTSMVIIPVYDYELIAFFLKGLWLAIIYLLGIVFLDYSLIVVISKRITKTLKTLLANKRNPASSDQ